MRCLITGGAGFIGSHCAEYYAKQGHEVVVLDNLMRSKIFGSDKESVEYNWRYLKQYENIKLIKGDVRDVPDICNPSHIESAIGDGVDLCIHTAGQPGVGYSIKEPMGDFSTNAWGTVNVLDALRKHSDKATFIYTSTNKVYGENVDRFKIKEHPSRYSFTSVEGVPETLPIDHTSHTPYGASKYVGDIYAQEYASTYGMKTGVFRMSCIYGPRQFGFEDQGWISHFVISTLLNKGVTIFGDGKQVRDVLYVDDLIQAFDYFRKSDIKSGVWNIGGGPKNTISLNELLVLLEHDIGSLPEIKHDDWRPSDQKVYISDTQKLWEELLWDSTVSPEEGIRKLINWTRENLELFKK